MGTYQPPAEVQAIHDLFKQHIRYYAPLTEAFGGNPVCSLVFGEFLYQDGLRLTRKAAFFSLTDSQLADKCGTGLDQTRRARDLICAPGIALFERVRLGRLGVNHYCGDYPRIYAWLQVNGLGTPRVRETPNPDYGKPAIRTAGNPQSLKILVQDFSDDDDGARARELSLRGALAGKGIQEPTLSSLARQMAAYDDALEGLEEIDGALMDELFVGGRPNKRIRSGAGLLIARLRLRFPVKETVHADA